ncbi:hypothetical protein PoB_001860800 [Plakobranchus ocellatus]|uniref:Secreted protein n=1 Tax=Plakobranchus ocellatus TaxID=259542 RepID=A0AAV3ZBK4_9GAST|nr:hypothetical protein PoB_001860800 [Plakobranchus ocellatus]
MVVMVVVVMMVAEEEEGEVVIMEEEEGLKRGVMVKEEEGEKRKQQSKRCQLCSRCAFLAKRPELCSTILKKKLFGPRSRPPLATLSHRWSSIDWCNSRRLCTLHKDIT